MKQQALLTDDTNLLPLFCGVPQQVEAENFAPKDDGRQLQLIPVRFEDMKKVENERK